MSIETINIQSQSIQPALGLMPQVQTTVKPVAKVETVVKAEVKLAPDLKHTEIDRNPGLSVDEIQHKIAELNQALVDKNQSIGFSTNSQTGHQVVTVSNWHCSFFLACKLLVLSHTDKWQLFAMA